MAWSDDLNDVTTTVLSTESALTDNTISAAGTEIDNSTGLYTKGFIEISAHTFATAADDDHPTLDFYISVAPDGTNYSDAPVTGGANQTSSFLVSIDVKKSDTSAQRIGSDIFDIPPCKFKVYEDNQCGQTLSANYVVKLSRTNN